MGFFGVSAIHRRLKSTGRATVKARAHLQLLVASSEREKGHFGGGKPWRSDSRRFCLPLSRGESF